MSRPRRTGQSRPRRTALLWSGSRRWELRRTGLLRTGLLWSAPLWAGSRRTRLWRAAPGGAGLDRVGPDRVGSGLVRFVRVFVVMLRLVAAGVALCRIARAARTVPPVRPTFTPAPSATGGITVVVPARDEATRIGPLLTAVVDAPGVDEVIVVDDRSSDDTAAMAARAGARVVDGSALPDGWTGKAWALQQGIEATGTDWVVTLDADTRPSPELPATLVGRALGDDLDMVTVAGRFECPTAGLRWLHPAMLTTLVYRFGPPGVDAAVRADRMMANGQCMALRRSPFLAAAGMEPVAGHPVEDVALARHVATSGWRVAFLDASEMLTVRMYDSLADAWRGWGRSLALPGVEPRHRQLLDLCVVLVAQALPLPRLVTGRADALDIGLLAVRIGTLAGTRRSYRQHTPPPPPTQPHPTQAGPNQPYPTQAGPHQPQPAGVAYWLSPLADLPATVALAMGIVRRRQMWRGRVYVAPRARPGRTGGR